MKPKEELTAGQLRKLYDAALAVAKSIEDQEYRSKAWNEVESKMDVLAEPLIAMGCSHKYNPSNDSIANKCKLVNLIEEKEAHAALEVFLQKEGLNNALPELKLKVALTKEKREELLEVLSTSCDLLRQCDSLGISSMEVYVYYPISGSISTSATGSVRSMEGLVFNYRANSIRESLSRFINENKVFDNINVKLNELSGEKVGIKFKADFGSADIEIDGAEYNSSTTWDKNF